MKIVLSSVWYYMTSLNFLVSKLVFKKLFNEKKTLLNVCTYTDDEYLQTSIIKFVYIFKFYFID